MPEHTSEELQKLAKPALRHAELIYLARTETPNKAYELALIRWPRRQAKAARFLAILRRDHGQRAFEALITQTEHAHPNGMEHAQGGNAMVTLDSLYPDGVRNVVFAPHAHTPDRLCFWLVDNNGKVMKKVKFQEEIDRLNLDSKQTQILVRRIIDAMIAQFANPKVRQVSGEIWASAMLAVRTYFPDDNEYYKKVFAPTIIYHGGCSRDPVNLLEAIIPHEEIAKLEQTIYTEEDENHLARVLPDKALQLVIDHGLKYFTVEEMQDLWHQMLQMRMRENYATAFIVEWWKNLKIDDKYLSDREVVKEIIRQCLVRELKDLLSQNRDTLYHGLHLNITGESYLRMLESLALSCWEWCRSEEGRECFEDLLMNCMARGQVAKASIILARLGSRFGLCSFEVTLCERVKFEESLHRLVWGAIEYAVDNRNFGVASALAEYLGENELADELREKARHLDQKLTFDFIFYTRGKR